MCPTFSNSFPVLIPEDTNHLQTADFVPPLFLYQPRIGLDQSSHPSMTTFFHVTLGCDISRLPTA